MTPAEMTPGDWGWLISWFGFSMLVALGIGAYIRYLGYCWHRGRARAWYNEQRYQWDQAVTWAGKTVETRLYERQKAE